MKKKEGSRFFSRLNQRKYRYGRFAVFLTVVNGVKGNLRKLKAYRVKDYLIVSGVGLLGTFLYNLFLVQGIDKLLASQAMIINYLWPMMAVVAGMAPSPLTISSTLWANSMFSG